MPKFFKTLQLIYRGGLVFSMVWFLLDLVTGRDASFEHFISFNIFLAGWCFLCLTCGLIGGFATGVFNFNKAREILKNIKKDKS